MKFSIITPTILRPSLLKCSESIDRQTHQDWEHIIISDRGFEEILMDIAHPRRKILVCEPEHHNFGNTCRHNGWTHATGDYCLYLDDDNFLSHPLALSSIDTVLSRDQPKWAIFPILRFGHPFFSDPPGLCHTDSANMTIQREIAQWPNRDEYTLDGIFCDYLKEHYPYLAYSQVPPIAVVPVQGKGER